MPWRVDFYEEQNGAAPVEEFLADLPRKHRAKALAIIKLLEEIGPALPFPHSSQVRGKLRELRTQQSKDKIRILYFADEKRWFILLHAFIKRTGKLSEKDIAIAEQRMNQHNLMLQRTSGGSKSSSTYKEPPSIKTNMEYEVVGEEKGKLLFRLPEIFGHRIFEGLFKEDRIEFKANSIAVMSRSRHI